MNESGKEENKERKSLELDSMKDEATVNKRSIKSIITWILIIGVGLMIIAYAAGFLIMGSPAESRRMGAIQEADSAIITNSDTTIGK